ncbi:hypothetical protein [Leptospira kirschneri]|uniref:hypothetical protein n=1 Tax=Leptospira kirschneri TaxID=29507 RepID=UPI0005186692|nr:hypothetical protein [Leptospira kirschneri]UML82066.1 hypothetical protein FH602_11180 [Leptospira kirschneri]
MKNFKGTQWTFIKKQQVVGSIVPRIRFSINTLKNWKKKYLTDDGPFRDALQEKVDRLEKQLAEVTEEREILKKFVEESIILKKVGI